jgi:hypothetical protein
MDLHRAPAVGRFLRRRLINIISKALHRRQIAALRFLRRVILHRFPLRLVHGVIVGINLAMLLALAPLLAGALLMLMRFAFDI